jgi:hypothetical protein
MKLMPISKQRSKACRSPDMVRIAISQAAFDAIAKTLPLGSVGYENAVNAKGERLIWLERRMLDKLNSYRRRHPAAGEAGRLTVAARRGTLLAPGRSSIDAIHAMPGQPPPAMLSL